MGHCLVGLSSEDLFSEKNALQLQVAGGKDESVMQPLWSPSGDLIFISDRSGFWNLYSEHSGSVKALLPMQAEFSSPAWVFGIRSYQILPDGR